MQPCFWFEREGRLKTAAAQSGTVAYHLFPTMPEHMGTVAQTSPDELDFGVNSSSLQV